MDTKTMETRIQCREATLEAFVDDAIKLLTDAKRFNSYASVSSNVGSRLVDIAKLHAEIEVLRELQSRLQVEEDFRNGVCQNTLAFGAESEGDI